MEKPFRDTITMLDTVIPKLNVDFMLTHKVKGVPAILLPEFFIFRFKLLNSGAQLLDYVGIFDVDVETDDLRQH